MKEVILYSTDWCPYCNAAKSLLSNKGVEYQEINVEGDTDKRAWLVEVTGQRTVPQIFIGGEPIGGYRELSQLDRGGELDKLLMDDS